LDQIIHNQGKVKGTFDHKERDRVLKEGHQVFLWDKKKKKPIIHKKFDNLWNGPYKIVSEEFHNSFNLTMLGGERIKVPVKAIHLKPYFPSEN